MPRRLPVRALALALALAAAAAAGVDAGGKKLPDCRLFAHVAKSNDPSSFPACSLLKSGKLLRVNFAPRRGVDFSLQPTSRESAIQMWSLGQPGQFQPGPSYQVNPADVPNGLIDLVFLFISGLASTKALPVHPTFDESYSFKTFSKRWKRMRKQGSKEGLPAIILDYSDDSTFETKFDKVKFGKKNGVVFAEYQVSKGSRAALASAWGSVIDEAAARNGCLIAYATPCPRLGLP